MNIVSRQTLDLLLPTYPVVRADDRREILADTAVFLHGHLRNASPMVRAGVAVLALAFRCWMLLALIMRWDPGTMIERWEALTGEPGRSLLRLVRSLVVLSFLEHPLVLRMLGMAQVADQQARFRKRRLQLIEPDAS